MENSRTCKSCNKKTVIRDEFTDTLVCRNCGIVQELDNFQASFGGINGPQGTFVRVGASASGEYSYKEKKLYEADKVIEDIALKLGFSAATSAEVKRMIQQITDEEFGGGEWFLVLVGACSYVVMRKNSRPLSIAEVASVIGCDVYELGRMIFRAVDFLDLKLPEFDIVTSFEQAIRTCPTFSRFSKDVMDKMVKQGRFLLQCAVKWFLTTGRRPLPMVSAILKFVAELNEVDVEIEDIAKEVHSTVATSKKRHKELKETLVKVAQKLPWGKDVTVKNIVKNAPLVIQYMEMKSRLKPGNKRKSIEPDWFNLEDVTNDSQYFELEDRNRVPCLSYDDVEKLKLSQECLAGIYSKFSKESSYFKNVGENGEDYQKNRRRYEDRESKEWWSGKSDLSKKLSLQQILEKNVGFNALPPSFVTGSLACKRRREKIDAAKLRIDEIMRPPSTVSGEKKDSCLLEDLEARKQQCKQSKGGNVDWEDFIIELLLLHQVREEEIEQGHYNTLLELHVFNSGNICEMFQHGKGNG
ncbi:PREDICTED: plant-specific TFIIB-related protein PTF2-like [Nelumbo nucifera]|uniref:Plant-specific TFIIB-related protein PTF2-like n=1 Tax=Nelumbo nucifera TaxID=4432 RepID=A0A1U7Z7K9_NELNU|nr:PREDICTED: plant-specific TFIIB-related protein PTF2-like [Nelumbo nucifera]XP_010243579.1 PREDICTED: plant-specific TFIIB-related protein PTF2-like [Nelumbo nucifera]XP_010243580.1 PREDICTED: plant-specific TFIIB-related protein PTF2-like [Nelumbo nucifera]XP_010243581.1 PREDICTED: plant-specific TFIIB-related protein PTF2-like [Nelumbo nucifera]XP_010243582.1 PREDICTED: plant-specific TFIIB-related protein PTF2-like [Nelumbo nucifera]XP_010243583.1 PREDICTED: plant-specific TFIIB-related 